ncbi:MAG: hypothetical protein LBI36_02305 [Oscillospiraceae bacterium]|jgi:hypothetical protein|nr:hypothetical protein [Oscillospiraceae bacterium]
MDTPKKNLYSVDEIHNMRVKTAERYSRMTPEEAERDFKRRVEEAEKTMEALREKKRLTVS